MVIDSNRERLLCAFLADHILVEEVIDLGRFRKFLESKRGRFGKFVFEDLIAEFDALIADIDTRARDQLLDLLLCLSTEGTLK